MEPSFHLSKPAHEMLESPSQTFPALIAFGDSILDTGNNNWLFTMTRANLPPNGRDFAGGKATGRYGNGLVLSNLIGLGIKFPLPAYLDPNLPREDLATGVCFASAGSGLDELTAKTVKEVEAYNISQVVMNRDS
ncbi:GDSL esterase/lipase At1g73610-like [Durio zibethinus]|uniref:GDSL esterase/lipase At1g73610-like n=1 Tax=Durio zibethinus TaxID=66656 RepID=A0A6P6B8R1_DURZI|nr:GDSL esterase/lipase At1g73610-like [Durio zibethinus]